MLCKCGAPLERFCLRPWAGGVTARCCADRRCPGPHLWAVEIADYWAWRTQVLDRVGHDLVRLDGKLVARGACLAVDEWERRLYGSLVETTPIPFNDPRSVAGPHRHNGVVRHRH